MQIARLKECGGEDLSNTNVFWLFFVNDLADLDLEKTPRAATSSRAFPKTLPVG